MLKAVSVISIAAALVSCDTGRQADPAASDSPPGLLVALAAVCGQAFEGRVTTTDPRDESFASQRLVMHVRDCEDDVVRAPFHVGEDRSRVWVFTRHEDGSVELKHNHRHEDGEQDALSWYGGRTLGPGSGSSLAFPADDFSKALFEAEGIPDSMLNTWFVTATDTEYVYELRRPNRHFRAVFDLTRPVETPPPAWGDEALGE
ncbi:MAG: hypothetical protein AAFX09_11495 [Pseudomonadota bacterium]